MLSARHMPNADPPPRVVAAFRPCRGVSNQNALPIPLTPLIDREGDIAIITVELSEPTIRGLTLTGSGSVGKTRLALAIVVTRHRVLHGVGAHP